MSKHTPTFKLIMAMATIFTVVVFTVIISDLQDQSAENLKLKANLLEDDLVLPEDLGEPVTAEVTRIPVTAEVMRTETAPATSSVILNDLILPETAPTTASDLVLPNTQPIISTNSTVSTSTIPQATLSETQAMQPQIIQTIDSNDIDKDGMTDVWEQKYGLDPLDSKDNSSDLDGDRLPALLEFLIQSNPSSKDTDTDKFDDFSELQNGYNPIKVNEKITPEQQSVMMKDTDGDGLKDWEEVIIGTDPILIDSDGNGIIDSDEIGVNNLYWRQ